MSGASVAGSRVVLGVALLVCACGRADRPAGVEPSVHPRRGALNTVFELRLGAAPDPLTLSERALRVSRPDGRALPARLSVTRDGVAVALVVDASIWNDPPPAARITVLGGPSAHALLRQDGSPWPETFAVSVELDPELTPGSPPGLSLRRRGAAEVVGGSLLLAFDGVLDPDTATDQCVPLFPESNGERLTPRYGPTAWQVVGGDTLVQVDLTALPSGLWCSTRRLTLRALDGSAPEPRLEFQLP